jgi:O-antigen ligase
MTNMLFCFLFAELVYRFVNKRRALPVNNIVLGSMLAAALASVFIERMRNGIIVLALLLLAAGLLSLFALRTRLRKTALVTATVALFLVAIGGLGVATAIKPMAPNFKDLVASVSIAWDTERYTAWRDDKQAPPVLPSGETIDTSVYQRIAWFKQGLLIAKEHPLGVGFGRNAFGHGLKAKHGEGGGHSHSGLLDLAIGTGVPGIILWLGFLASLGYLAWKQYRHTRSFAALLLMLILLDFSARMVVDSIIRDHMLQQFMFLAGLAAVLTVAEVPEKRKASA